VRLFKRGPSEPETAGEFWSWWSGARDRVAGAIATGGFDERLVNDISRAVQTIHPAMAWELAPGKTAQHAFCISPEGNAEVRQAALRWLASAPPADATWEYHASKQASPRLMGLEVATWRFDLEEMRAISSWDASRRRVDVRLWHPGFADAPEAIRLQAGFVFLDSLLGEDDVERWIGEIDLLEEPTGGRTPAELKSEIGRRQAEPAGETWVLGELTGANGSVAIVLADAGLKRIDHPFADHHVTLDMLFGADRMPTDAEATILNEEEDDLLRRLGDVAIYAGRVTQPGSRTMHFVAADPDRMRPAIDGWAQDLPDSLSDGLPQRRLKINFEEDMDWSFQRELGMR
jgi:Family of unknown function (DUF695)